MGWITLITALVKVFGPLIAKWLERWLEKRLKQASQELVFTTFGNENEARDALFDKAILMTSNPIRRLLLIRLKTRASEMEVTSTGAKNPMSVDAFAEIKSINETIELDD